MCSGGLVESKWSFINTVRLDPSTQILQLLCRDICECRICRMSSTQPHTQTRSIRTDLFVPDFEFEGLKSLSVCVHSQTTFSIERRYNSNANTTSKCCEFSIWRQFDANFPSTQFSISISPSIFYRMLCVSVCVCALCFRQNFISG